MQPVRDSKEKVEASTADQICRMLGPQAYAYGCSENNHVANLKKTWYIYCQILAASAICTRAHELVIRELNWHAIAWQ